MESGFKPTVVVLISTYNGEKYLREQLDSLYAQENVELKIIVRDDGSCDRTLIILDDYSSRYKNLVVLKGCNIGATRSFYQLVYYVLENVSQGDYYAFCDQDDYWPPEKLVTAINAINQLEGTYKMYFCNSTYVDAELSFIKESSFYYDGNFKHCILRNIALGCTMVFNSNMFLLAGQASKSFFVKDREKYIPLHDVWFYAFAHCINASIFYDRSPHLLYRQHGSNVTQANKSLVRRYLLGIRNTFKNPDSHLALASCLYQCNCYFGNNVTNYLNHVVFYKNSLIKTLTLAKMIDLRGESFADKILWRLMILFRVF